MKSPGGLDFATHPPPLSLYIYIIYIRVHSRIHCRRNKVVAARERQRERRDKQRHLLGMELFLSDNLQPASTKVLSRPLHVFTSSRRQIYTRLVSNDSQVYRVNDYSGGSIRALPSSIPDSRLLLETFVREGVEG